QPADLVLRQRPYVVPLEVDERYGVRHRGGRTGRGGGRRGAGGRPRGTGRVALSTSSAAPPASSSSWRQRPQGSSGAPSPATTATATSTGTSTGAAVPAVPGGAAPVVACRAGAGRAVACRAETRPHSAHSVRPNDAFSTLQPVTIRPSAVSPAAPTRSREYGA